ncbi:NUDIX hydrolase [Methylobacterium sp. J-030]|uniref:NUDIX hydrolase n=1 Tax=Methylobacterium sp. J-030 TaxID=2836627 RepID=UPI001FB91702|nr:NUDIX hydrolase [Methylobacterium sp. J-030]MCJ2067676.1 NUDIX hydrolase [Methylobacterium sp. J-030]
MRLADTDGGGPPDEMTAGGTAQPAGSAIDAVHRSHLARPEIEMSAPGMNDGTWAITASRHIVRDRWLSIRADDCVTPSGAEIAPYYLVESRDFVHTLAFDASDRAILVRQYRHGYAGLTLELPGGIMDEGETDIVQAAIRELSEETGFSGGTARHRVSLSPDPGRYTNRVHLVLAEGVAPGRASPEPTEDIEIVLTPRAELAALACSGAVTNAGHVGFILLALASGIGF